MNTPSTIHTPRFKDEDKPGYLNLSYEELQERNLELREKAEKGEDSKEAIIEKLKGDEGKRVKAVTVFFSDLEGKLQFLDFDKEHILSDPDNLTFDGSSISGFTQIDKSDLRFSIDWSSFRWAPADVFGEGKVIVFADIRDKEGNPYEGDFRSRLKARRDELKDEEKITVNVAPETEGFLLKGQNAEKTFDPRVGQTPASLGGYFSTLPQDELRQFIDRLAEATRAMGFRNEKDHGEVAPGQFELNYKYRDIVAAADQVLLYKLVARQLAHNMGHTASFLPKPIAGINGSGMHTNMSLSKEGKNIFYDAKGKDQLSEEARASIAGILNRLPDICLALNSSVNAYRRLDPNFEAPNEVKVSDSDRSSAVRIPIGNENSARMEVRTVAPDANPYLAWLLILEASEEGRKAVKETRAELMQLLETDRDIQKLPGTIQEAIDDFGKSKFTTRIMGEGPKERFIELKEGVADRSPRKLGTKVKKWEVIDHHEVRNQELSNDF